MTDSTKLSYNEATNSLSYNSQSITDHSWAVFKIQKASNFNIPKEALNSKAPWAVLAMNVFYVPTLPDITTAAEAAKEDKVALVQLQSEISLLKNELRFSAYDRAVALKSFADQEKGIIQAACATGGVTEANCKTPQIDQFSKTIAMTFGLDVAKDANLKSGADKVNKALRTQLKLN